MPRLITLFLVFFLLGNAAFATINISLSNPSSQTLLVSYKANSNYNAAPFNIWNSQVFTMRWSTVLGANVITGIQNKSAFVFALDGAAVNGNDGFFYQKFTAAMTNLSQGIATNAILPVLQISLFNAGICGGDFELITGTAFVNSIFGTASVNNVLGEQFNGFDPALAETVLLNPSATLQTWHADTDGDGKGNPAVSQVDCVQPAGFVSNQLDCDDTNPNLPATPGSTCNDGNPNTINDVIQANGCDCAGTLVDCPVLGLNFGASCNDNDPCTVNDVVTASCGCAGIFQDSDNDDVCDANDLCPGSPEPGSPCNDNDPTTTNDQINANCQCKGTPTNCTGIGDADGDSVCTGFDCNDNDPQATSTIGTSCNDGNPCTINDKIQAGCGCVGTFQDSDNDGICDANDVCPSGPNPGTPCNDNDPTTINDQINANCQCKGTPTNCTGIGDADGDGVCTGFDCNDNDPQATSTIGTSCNDGNPCTINDKIQAGCGCVGTFQDSDNDGICDANDVCPNGPNPGTPCNDNNPNTTGETIQSNCACGGGTTGPDCPALNLNIGDACDDGDICTINDKVQSDCTCKGTFQDSDNDGTCDANDICQGPEPGTACNDNNPNTVNDMVNSNCQCAGVPPSQGITLTCPPDIEIVVPTGVSGTHLNFPSPLASTICNGGAGCNPAAIPGFVLMGEFGGSLFYLSSTSKSWEEARLDCTAKGGRLAVITSAAKNQFIANHLGYGNAAYIGLTDKDSEGNFKWVNGTSLSYSNWEAGEPNNGYGFPENFVVMHGWTLGKWADYDVWVQKPYILEITCNPGGGSGSGLAGTQTAGPSSGSFFSVGQHTITYKFTDNCGNQKTCSFLVKVVEDTQPTDCIQLVNLALNKTPQHSSTRFNAPAIRAADGNSSGNFWLDFSVSHTEWEDNAWWQVDLGKTHDLKYINIWNRTDCCQQYLSNFYVLVSETPFTSTSLSATLAQPGVTAYYQGGEVGLPTAIATEQKGRYVRVQLAGQAFLAMAEIEIFGCISGSNLLYFNANPTATMDVQLHWINNSQTTNDYFVVEKSLDGMQFDSLLSKDGAGPEDKVKMYQDLDRNPEKGDNYYRLKLVFKDGSFEYSEIRKITFTPESNFTIFPNPAGEQVTVYMDKFIGKEVDLIIVNPLGKTVFKEHFSPVKDKLFPIELDRDRFIDGIYPVSVVHRGKVYSKRLVVSRF